MADGIMKTQGLGEPGEPTAPPPSDPEGGYAPPPDDATGGIGSTDWFAASFGLVLCGERMSNDKIKKIVYGGAALVLLLVLLLVMLVATGTLNHRSTSSPPPPPQTPRKENVVHMEFGTKTTQKHGKPKSKEFIVQWGTQCEAFSNKGSNIECFPDDDGGKYNDEQTPNEAKDTGGCGMTSEGEVFAYHRDPTAWCVDSNGDKKNPDCGWNFGPKVKHGKSEVDFGVKEGSMICSLSASKDAKPCVTQDKITVFDAKTNKNCTGDQNVG
eukprot:COSAG05_NODE_983_length_6299_cov_14.948387_5_plen_269_part_00